MTDSLAVYREDIISEAQDPQNYGLLKNPDQTATYGNRSCGDRVTVSLIIDQLDGNWQVSRVGWEGEGCVISRACASMLSQKIVGKSLTEVERMKVGGVLHILGLTSLSPGREKCAEVALLALQTAVQQHRLTQGQRT